MNMKLLKIRLKKKRKKPNFLRQNAGNIVRIGNKWRRPKGISSKLRRHKKSRGSIPHPGYGSPRAVKFLHPSGLEEKLVSNMSELNGIDNTKQCMRISAKVGNRKRIDIQKKAEEMKIKILNPKKVELKVKKKKEEKKKEETKSKPDKKETKPKSEKKKEEVK